jgi:hypothetical protein
MKCMHSDIHIHRHLDTNMHALLFIVHRDIITNRTCHSELLTQERDKLILIIQTLSP